MKKGWILFFILICCLSACSTNSDEHVFSQKIFQSFVNSTHNSIPNTIQDGAIQVSINLDGQHYPSGTEDITLSIVNNGDPLFFGTPYLIEKFDEKSQSWKEVTFRKDVGFDQIGLTINQSMQKDEKITIGSSMLSKPLASGFYRVIKSFSTDGDKTIKLSAIFQLL